MTRALLAVLSLILPVLAAAPADAATLPSKSQWQADVRQAMQGSVTYLDRRVPQGGGPLAIVLDIDNTSLATHYAWPQPVRPTLRFARHAHALGVGVFFVTGRYQDSLHGVRRTLKQAGYTVTGMCGRRHGEALAHGKQRCRRQITHAGWRIIADVGNRASDLVGGNYERGFRLPSYGGKLS
ncbi:HAD family acid phosphatase [Nocardioides panacihumi]|uniref:HAD family acid phosphatase n=1 Tax=Nocardioides panacihumi TaxID=400774 RepID=A0ABN2RQJ8_9ACTN